MAYGFLRFMVLWALVKALEKGLRPSRTIVVRACNIDLCKGTRRLRGSRWGVGSRSQATSRNTSCLRRDANGRKLPGRLRVLGSFLQAH